jgi:hypothetical protein
MYLSDYCRAETIRKIVVVRTVHVKRNEAFNLEWFYDA